MSTILDTIAAHARQRVAADKLREPPEALMARCAGPGRGQAFYDAVRREGLSFICEIKRASPSRGLIDPAFDYLSIARDYAAAGADCVSCLTEPNAPCTTRRPSPDVWSCATPSVWQHWSRPTTRRRSTWPPRRARK